MSTRSLDDELTLVSQWLAAGDIDRARARLVQLTKKNPSVAKAHYMLGQCLRRMGRPKEAMSALKTAIALENHPNSHYMLGLCLEDIGNRDGAVSVYRHILKMAPNHERTKKRLAILQPTHHVPRQNQRQPTKFDHLGDDIDKGLYTEQKSPFVFKLQRAFTFVVVWAFFSFLFTFMGTQMLPLKNELVAVIGAVLALVLAILSAGNVSRFKEG